MAPFSALGAASGKKFIALAGYIHHAWYSELSDVSGKRVGAEFATPSVSSPGFEAIFGNNPQVLAGMEQAFALLINDLQYLDASQRGYMMVTFSNNNAEADWRFVASIATKNTSTITGKKAIES